jgi:LuxR family maltose regulon positive regulatory protein
VAALRALVTFYDGGEGEQIADRSNLALALLSSDELGLRGTLLQNLGYVYQGLYGVQAAERAWREAKQLWEAGGHAQAPFTAAHEHAWVAAWRGQLREAEAICRQALQSITDPSPIAGVIYNQLGEVLVERGAWEAAEHALTRGRELLKLAPWPERQAGGLAILVCLQQAQGNLVGAIDLVDEMERLSPKTAQHVGNLRARLWLAQADRYPRCLQRALCWAEGRELPLGSAGYHDMTPLTLIRVRIAQCRLAEHRSNLGPTLQFLDGYLAYAEQWGATGQAIEALNLRALALQAAGDPSPALASLQRALALGEPEGYVYAFIREGAPMVRLLVGLRHGANVPAHLASYLDRLLAAFPGDESSTSAASPLQESPAEPLTPRETEVLRLVAAGASNPEIAAALFIAVDTVKRHCTHIFQKLGVSNRTQAAARARELSLVE